MFDYEPYLSVARTLGSAAGGALVTFGILSIGDTTAAADGFTHIANGVKEIAIGAGTLAVPAATLWGFISHRPIAILTAAAKLNTQEKTEAFHGIPDAAKVAAVEAIQGVTKILVNPSATPSVIAAAADTSRPKVQLDPLMVRGS